MAKTYNRKQLISVYHEIAMPRKESNTPKRKRRKRLQRLPFEGLVSFFWWL